MTKQQKPRNDPKVYELGVHPGEHESEALGRSSVGAAFNAAASMQSFQGHMGGTPSLMATIGEVQRITDAIKGGDLSGLEAMLVGQAISLQTIYTSLARRAQAQSSQRNLEAFLGLAFKAQAQSRATIQAVADLKFPRQVAFVKQANISAGNQQVNNGVCSPAGNLPSQQNKILEATDGKWVDGGAPRAAIGTDPQLEAVGAVDRPKDRTRKSRRVA